jgi:hypothetical protein
MQISNTGFTMSDTLPLDLSMCWHVAPPRVTSITLQEIRRDVDWSSELVPAAKNSPSNSAIPDTKAAEAIASDTAAINSPPLTESQTDFAETTSTNIVDTPTPLGTTSHKERVEVISKPESSSKVKSASGGFEISPTPEVDTPDSESAHEPTVVSKNAAVGHEPIAGNLYEDVESAESAKAPEDKKNIAIEENESANGPNGTGNDTQDFPVSQIPALEDEPSALESTCITPESTPAQFDQHQASHDQASHLATADTESYPAGETVVLKSTPTSNEADEIEHAGDITDTTPTPVRSLESKSSPIDQPGQASSTHGPTTSEKQNSKGAPSHPPRSEETFSEPVTRRLNPHAAHDRPRQPLPSPSSLFESGPELPPISMRATAFEPGDYDSLLGYVEQLENVIYQLNVEMGRLRSDTPETTNERELLARRLVELSLENSELKQANQSNSIPFGEDPS